MMRSTKYITKILSIVLPYMICIVLSISVAFAQSCGGSSCSNSTCSLSLNNSGQLSNNCPSGTRYDVDPNCIMNQNSSPNSCLDTMPVGSINRVSETNCFRANGAGGNSKPRNHLGTDYASSQGTVVTAAADGTVVWAKPMGGGGRTIIIEHEKVCQCSIGNSGGNCDDKYVTVYMHLQSFAVTGGSVKKGDIIGWVGGSNFVSGSGVLCDYPDTDKMDGCTPYGPHLHFEIHSGAWKKGYSSLKTSIINPLCDDIQQFCGGCSYDVQKCQDKDGAQDWEPLNEEAQATKRQATSTGQLTAPTSSDWGTQATYASTSGKCDYNQYVADAETCWFCPVFKVLFNTSSTIAIKAYGALAKSIAIVVVVAFAIWISIYVLKHVSAIEVKDPRKMLQELMLQAFKVFIVVLILQANYFQVIQLTLEPVFNTGMAFVQAISESNGCPSNASYMQGINGYDSATGITDNSSGGLPYSMGANIICSIKSMQDSISKMYAYGRQAWCVAWGPGAWLFGILPHFGFLLTGIMIMIAAFILMFAFPWCLVDCIIQMSIASALAPAAIGAWAFKSTKSYLKKIWDFFMNAMFNFVFLSIILYIIMTVVDQFMKALMNRAVGSWDFLIDPINGLAYWGVGGLKLTVVCLIGWVFLDEGKSFADKFAKGASLGIGRRVGGVFAQAGTKIGKSALSAGKTVGGAALQVGDHFIGSKIREGVNKYRINKVKNGADNIITDNEGNIIGYERTRRNLFLKNVTRRVNINADGKEVWSKEKQSRRAEISNFIQGKVNKARTNIMFNRDRDENGDLIGAKDIFDENGILIARETEHTKEFYDSDGNITAREHYHRNLIGRKVTTREEIDSDGQSHLTRTKSNVRMEILSALTPKNSAVHNFAQTHMIAKERDLSKQNERSKIISSDKFISSRQLKDKNGNILQEDFAFTPQIEKYLVNRDGTINQNMLSTIIKNSTFDKQTILKAASLVVLKSRGIYVDNKFNARDVTFDENGTMTFLQHNRNGSVTEISMKMGGPNGNQMLTEVKQTSSNGIFTIVKDNGIQKCTISQYTNGEVKAHYTFGDEYLRRHKYFAPLNSNGEFANGIDKEAAMFGMDDADFKRHVAQIRTGMPQDWTPPVRNPKPYHEDGKIATMDNPISKTTIDTNGWKTTAETYVDPNGWVVSSKTILDDKGRIRETLYNDDQGASHTSIIGYDDTNNTSAKKETWTDKHGRTTITYTQYDAQGEIVSERSVDGNGNPIPNDNTN